jgi:hypothetical protein
VHQQPRWTWLQLMPLHPSSSASASPLAFPGVRPGHVQVLPPGCQLPLGPGVLAVSRYCLALWSLTGTGWQLSQVLFQTSGSWTSCQLFSSDPCLQYYWRRYFDEKLKRKN